MIDDEQSLLQEAQALLCRAKFQILQEEALATLAGSHGLALARLWPGSQAIQVATFDGAYLGRVRRAHSPAGDCQWLALARAARKSSGPYPTDRAAAQSLPGEAPARSGRGEAPRARRHHGPDALSAGGDCG